jgi:hypothetical protein
MASNIARWTLALKCHTQPKLTDGHGLFRKMVALIRKAYGWSDWSLTLPMNNSFFLLFWH